MRHLSMRSILQRTCWIVPSWMLTSTPAVPKKPRIRDVAQKDRFRMTPAAKKVLEEAYKPKGHRKLRVTGPEVLAQILALQPPDPAAVLLGALGVNASEVRSRMDAGTPES